MDGQPMWMDIYIPFDTINHEPNKQCSNNRANYSDNKKIVQIDNIQHFVADDKNQCSYKNRNHNISKLFYTKY
ncbi:hypothetical protein BLOT_012964 [Blomia tropicalis]|nr:hypothetical protein BLOT_012964 [Blomia tropicalis]